MNAKSALVREAHRSVLVPAGEQPVLTDSSGASSGQAPGLAHPPLCDQADRDVCEHQQASLDSLADRRTARATASPSPPVPNNQPIGGAQRREREWQDAEDTVGERP